MTTFAGIFYDGRAPLGRPVGVTIDGDAVVVTDVPPADVPPADVPGAEASVVVNTAFDHAAHRDDPAPAKRIARTAITVDAPVPGVARRLSLPGGAVIESDDTAAVDALWPTRRGVARMAYRLERSWPLSLTCAVLGALAVWVAIVYALPYAAEPVAREISPEVEAAIGRQVLATLDRLDARPTTLGEGERAHIVGLMREFMTDEDDVAPYHLVFRRLGGPNAFALPGNTIVVSDELVRFVKSDDELLAVLAHEIGHLRRHHAVRMVLQQSGIAVLATALAGDAVGVTFLAAAVPAMTLGAHYSQGFELEADDEGLAQLRRHGRSPQAFADVMRRFASSPATQEPDSPLYRYLSSHPATQERIRRAEAAAR